MLLFGPEQGQLYRGARGGYVADRHESCKNVLFSLSAKKANKTISQNVKLFFVIMFMKSSVMSKIRYVWSYLHSCK